MDYLAPLEFERRWQLEAALTECSPSYRDAEGQSNGLASSQNQEDHRGRK